jgi:peptidoglycan/LPS O-acetylase OafA/YrhL
MYVVRYIVGEDYAHQKYVAGEWGYSRVVISFCIYFALSLSLGVALSRMIEKPMLILRDRWFPRRSQPIEVAVVSAA